MNLPIERDMAKPVMWVWPCRHCGQVIHILAIKGAINAESPCEHFILARLSHQGMSVQFARDVAEQEAGPMRMQRE